MKVNELLDDIRNRDLVLPEFQREYVWTKEQAKQLLVSLIKGYPVGSLLLWKTSEPPDLKNYNTPSESVGTVQVLLDGQQRLTTLYLLLTGQIPPYYTENDLETDPRDLFYNIESGDFQYYQSSKMADNPVWLRVIDIFKESPDVFKIATQVAKEEDPFPIARHFNERVNSLTQVRQIDLPEQLVPTHATLGEAIDIFDRVNSQGTKLTDADLALTHITGKWSDARRRMKQKIEELGHRNFYFDLTFMTRALTVVVTNHALFPAVHDRSREELEAGWKKLDRILDYLTLILPSKAYIHSTEDLNTTNVLMPWITYLSVHGGKFSDEAEIRNAIHWIYAAHTWSRYTAQTDQRLEQDVSLVIREISPWEALREQIIDQRGRIEVKPSDFEGRGIQHPLFRMAYIVSKAHGAMDWFNGVPLGQSPKGRAYQLHNHHIFPQSLLYEGEFNSDSHLDIKVVNEIANRAYLTADSNVPLSNTPPAEYLPTVKSNFPGALDAQFVPVDPELWKLDRYDQFLQTRRALMAKKINEFMDGLITEPAVVHERSVEELIALGESATLEFKSTLQWDVVEQCVNKALRFSVLKTIAAFMNSSGGTLVIGVEDTGDIYGLENDLKQFKGSSDQFDQTITNLLSRYIGAEFSSFVGIRFETVQDTPVCVVDIKNGMQPAFLEEQGERKFYVRLGATTRALDPQETVNYISMNWE